MVWLLLGWGGLLPPRRAAYVLGGVGVLGGAQVTMTDGWGHVLALVTVASLGMVMTVPPVIDRYFPGVLAAPLALLVAGAVLLAAAVQVARRRGHGGDRAAARFSGEKRIAVALAGFVALGVSVAVLLLSE
ncbi:MAG: hypothetical protein ACLGIA_03110 [Actinomycetes bacterium]